jgi:SAM-dependent methyltransferase
VTPFDTLWAGDLLDQVGIGPADRVLDLAAAAARGGGGSRLPFADASFDVVLCPHGLQLLPDRDLALAEMRRVLVPRGRAAVAVWGPIARNPAFAALAESLERRAGPRVAAAVRWLFCLPEPDDLRATLALAGFDAIRVRPAGKAVRFPSVADFLRRSLPASPAGPATAHLSAQDRRRVLDDLETALSPWVDTAGLQVVTEANTAVATRV